MTVLRALESKMPGHSYTYLGDTARLPYGTKSPETVVRYARKAVTILMERGVDVVVVACNTASSFAIEKIQSMMDDRPVFGVVEPSANAAVKATKSGCIVVLATETTVRGRSYPRRILAKMPQARVICRSCPLLVALAEEGWVSGEIPRSIVRFYLRDWMAQNPNPRPDVILLGCTHFPVLKAIFAEVIDDYVELIDSADTVAAAVFRILGPGNGRDSRTLLATDDCARFARVGSMFLNEKIDEATVELVDL